MSNDRIATEDYVDAAVGGSGAPADAQYLTAASNAGLSAEVVVTAAGLALLDDAAASDQRTTLGLGTLATQSGTFSGTSSGTNTGDQTDLRPIDYPLAILYYR